ncbi:unnamed protein product [Polarella glacialis]|uniref:Uncharacterized protein n=1 Tax=Polarella glacialis TaxID=89957 RepID=A0A813HM89_POLGL|nr:unnamed protein product [Polarella glacialis]
MYDVDTGCKEIVIGCPWPKSFDPLERALINQFKVQDNRDTTCVNHALLSMGADPNMVCVRLFSLTDGDGDDHVTYLEKTALAELLAKRSGPHQKSHAEILLDKGANFGLQELRQMLQLPVTTEDRTTWERFLAKCAATQLSRAAEHPQGSRTSRFRDVVVPAVVAGVEPDLLQPFLAENAFASILGQTLVNECVLRSNNITRVKSIQRLIASGADVDATAGDFPRKTALEVLATGLQPGSRLQQPTGKRERADDRAVCRMLLSKNARFNHDTFTALRSLANGVADSKHAEWSLLWKQSALAQLGAAVQATQRQEAPSLDRVSVITTSHLLDAIIVAFLAGAAEESTPEAVELLSPSERHLATTMLAKECASARRLNVQHIKALLIAGADPCANLSQFDRLQTGSGKSALASMASMPVNSPGVADAVVLCMIHSVMVDHEVVLKMLLRIPELEHENCRRDLERVCIDVAATQLRAALRNAAPQRGRKWVPKAVLKNQEAQRLCCLPRYSCHCGTRLRNQAFEAQGPLLCALVPAVAAGAAGKFVEDARAMIDQQDLRTAFGEAAAEMSATSPLNSQFVRILEAWLDFGADPNATFCLHTGWDDAHYEYTALEFLADRIARYRNSWRPGHDLPTARAASLLLAKHGAYVNARCLFAFSLVSSKGSARGQAWQDVWHALAMQQLQGDFSGGQKEAANLLAALAARSICCDVLNPRPLNCQLLDDAQSKLSTADQHDISQALFPVLFERQPYIERSTVRASIDLQALRVVLEAGADPNLRVFLYDPCDFDDVYSMLEALDMQANSVKRRADTYDSGGDSTSKVDDLHAAMELLIDFGGDLESFEGHPIPRDPSWSLTPADDNPNFDDTEQCTQSNLGLSWVQSLPVEDDPPERFEY